MSGGLSEHRGMNSVANRLTPVIDAFLGGEPPIAFRFWDGSSLGAAEADTAIVLKAGPDSLLAWVFDLDTGEPVAGAPH